MIIKQRHILTKFQQFYNKYIHKFISWVTIKHIHKQTQNVGNCKQKTMNKHLNVASWMSKKKIATESKHFAS